jgi:broad specificity phosphatase PhoE
MLIYVFRHGQTIESKANINYSPDRRINADILPETIPVIEKLAHHLKEIPTSKNYTSPIKRCLQTVEIVKNISGKEFKIDENLKEWMEPEESFEALADRVSSFYSQLLIRQLADNTQQIAICTHGGVIAGLKSICEIGKFPIERLHDYPMPGVLLILDTTEGKIEEVDFTN